MTKPITTDADLLRQVERFCLTHDLKPTTFGRMAIGDGNLVANMRADRSLTLKTANRVVGFMAGYRPTQQDAAA